MNYIHTTELRNNMALQNFGISPYFDDYSEEDRYLKILFRPGFAVQARELNQLQTILQNQIQRFGNHVFENGSLVLNGETSLEKNQEYIRFQTPSNLLEITEDTSLFEGQIVRKRQFFSIVVESTTSDFEEGQYVETTGRSAAGVVESFDSTTNTLVVRKLRGIFKPSTTESTIEIFSDSVDSTLVPNENLFVAKADVVSVTPVVSNLPNADVDVDLTEAVITKVVGVTSDGDPLTFYVSYASGKGDVSDQDDPDDFEITFARADLLEVERPALIPNTRFTTFDLNVEDSEEAIGEGVILSINEGIYYLFGFFHLIEAQDIVVKKYGTLQFNEIFSAGLFAEQELVTPEQDSDLLDNARGSTNFSAPGAHRYKVFPRFVNGADFVDNENYIEVVKIERGEISTKVDRTFYSAIEDALARRTSEQSGDYVVNEFDLQLLEHLDDGDNGGYFPNNPTEQLDDNSGLLVDETLVGDETKLVALVSSGKAIVKGYESETFNDIPINIDKARDTEQLDDVPLFLRNGSFVYVKGLTEVPFDVNSQVISLILLDANNVIGSAKLKATIQEDTYNSGTLAYHRLYLFDIQINTGNTFGQLRKIEIVSTTNNPNTTVDLTEDTDVSSGINDFSVIDGVAILTRSSDFDNTLIYELPVGTVANTVPPVVEDLAFRYTNEKNSELNAGNYRVVFSNTDQARFSENPEFYVLSEQDSNATGNNHKILVVPISGPNGEDVVVLGSDASTVTINLQFVPGADTTQSRKYRVSTRLIKPATTFRSKETRNRDEDITLSAGDIRVIQLSQPDGISLSSVSKVETDGTLVDITNLFEFSGGQRDSFYDHSFLTLKSGVDSLAAQTDIRVNYNYYEHGVTGDYFSVESYVDTPYEDIPVHKTESGESLPLANAIDFRPVIDNTSPQTEEFTSELIFNPDSEIKVTYNFFLGRIDKLVVTSKGELEILKGQPDRQPSAPDDKDGSMNLYQFKIPPYTFDVTDVEIKKFDNRRFTMKDIGEIQNRVENLEYYTLLSLLEADTVNKEFVDKFKSGFVVDNFETQEVADGSDENHKIATDIENKLIRPIGETKSINLEVDNINTDSVRVSNNGEIITLPYEEFVSVSQPVASKLEKITALLNFGWFGDLKLTPSTDVWHSRLQRPDLTLDGGVVETARFTRLKDSLGTIWNNWRTNWTGIVGQNTRTSSQTIQPARWVGNRLQSTVRTTRTTTTTTAVRQTRTGVVNTPITRVSVRPAGNRLVSNTAIPFMRSRTISFELKGMKPNSPLFLFMDGKEITGFVQEVTRDGVTTTFSDNEASFTTGIAGELSGKFVIPNDAGLKIRTGTKDVIFTDSSTGDDGSTEATAKFTSTGRLLEYQRTFISTRVLDVDTSIVRDSRTVTRNTTSSTSTVNSVVSRVRRRTPSVRFRNTLFRRRFSRNRTLARSRRRNSFSFFARGGSTVNLRGLIRGGFRVLRNGVPVFSRPNTSLLLRTRFSSGPSGTISRFTIEGTGNTRFGRNRRTSFGNIRVRTPRTFRFRRLRRPVRRRRDPTAQSFVLPSLGGGFLTGLDFFMGEIPTDNRFPVTVQIRSMVNGYPGPEIMPFANIFIPAENLVGSNDATVPLHVDFDAPVYLEQDREYCFVILSDSPELTVWSSKLGDIALPYVDPVTGETKRNEQIVKQPHMGSLFRSQNNTTWNAVQEEDLKFNLYQAKFDIEANAQVGLINRTLPDDEDVLEVDPYFAQLDDNALETFEGSTFIKVHQQAHGFVAGIDRVTFVQDDEEENEDLPDDINGIPAPELFPADGHLVVNRVETDETLNDTIDPDFYYIQVQTSAVEGSRPELPFDIVCNENVGFSQFYFKTDEIKLKGTEINWEFSGNLRDSARAFRTNSFPVVSNDNYELGNSFISSASSVEVNGNLTNGDVNMVGLLSSDNENLSPVIDIEQVTLLATENKINEKKDIDGEANGYEAAARYILKKVDLVNPADQLRVYLDTNVPPGASVELFYRVKPEGSSVLLEDTAWEKVNPVEGIIVTEDENNFSESEYRVEDINENFTSFNLKIVFSSPAKHRVPRVKNLRAIALKDNPNL